jgi:DNA polymerase alpha subunit B
MAVIVESLAEELKDRFSISSNDQGTAILGELQSILRIHDALPEELSFKWESYCIKMGVQETQLDLKTVRDFKRDLQDTLERESRAKAHAKAVDKKPLMATPRAKFGAVDVLNMSVAHTCS